MNGSNEPLYEKELEKLQRKYISELDQRRASEVSMDEMIRRFNIGVNDMDIPLGYKMRLLGMITAIGFKYKQDIGEIASGKWIYDEDEGYYCPVCGFHVDGCTGNVMSGDYLYCPHCGVRLEDENELLCN